MGDRQTCTKRALLISADSRPLLGCVVNLESMVNLLTDHCKVEKCNISTLVNLDSHTSFASGSEEANAENVKKALSSLIASCQNGDAVMIYFVGHSNAEDGEAYFACSDEEVIEGAYIREVARTISDHCRLYFLMDTCQAGAFFEAYNKNVAANDEVERKDKDAIDRKEDGFLRKTIKKVSSFFQKCLRGGNLKAASSSSSSTSVPNKPTKGLFFLGACSATERAAGKKLKFYFSSEEEEETESKDIRQIQWHGHFTRSLVREIEKNAGQSLSNLSLYTRVARRVFKLDRKRVSKYVDQEMKFLNFME